jgi:hypothetical protein
MALMGLLHWFHFGLRLDGQVAVCTGHRHSGFMPINNGKFGRQYRCAAPGAGGECGRSAIGRLRRAKR